MADRSNDDELQGMSPDDRIIAEAKERFKQAYDYESDFRNLYIQDVKFANADSDNGWQWPNDLRKDREVNKRPALTINKVANHVALITNEERQSQTSINVKPVGNQATYDAAQMFEGIFRHIEYVSAAQSVYSDASDSQVEGGIAYWRVNTRYVSDEGSEAFDQEIIIEPFRDQMNVLLDCFIKQRDGSDAKWGFVFEDVPNKEFNREYPDVDVGGSTPSGVGDSGDWIKTDCTRVAEYYRILEKEDELIYMTDGDTNEPVVFRKSDVPAKYRGQIAEAEKEGKEVKRRSVMTRQLQWFKIAGSKIIDRREKMPGKYIPIVRVPGKERIIEGKLERKGHVRTLKDAQRMYNYNTSGQVEFGALATKAPWVGPAAAFAGNENDWNNANRLNKAYLTFNHVDEDGQPIPAPQRPEPPGTSPAFLAGMEVAAKELTMASGQEDAQFGKQSNEKSGKAIAERQRQSDTITAHFADHMAMAKRYTGKIIIDLIPHYYDTERVIQILGEDGKQSEIMIKPDAQQAYQEEKQENEDKVKVIFNPAVGKYEVEADIGPAYSTQRQEAWNAFVQIVTGAPELINEIGDLMFQSADFPLADKIAERLKRKIRNSAPWLFDDQAPTPAMQQLQAQLNDQTQLNSELLQKVAELRLKLIGKEQMRDIDAYEAETKRGTAVANMVPEVGDADGLPQLIRKTIISMMTGKDLTEHIEQVGQEDENPQLPGGEGGEGQPPVEGAQQAPDGHWYVPDPRREGKFMRVHPRANGAG